MACPITITHWPMYRNQYKSFEYLDKTGKDLQRLLRSFRGIGNGNGAGVAEKSQETLYT